MRIDLDGQPHPRTVLTEQGISKERTETLFSVQPEETCRKEVVRTKGIEENGSFCAPSLQGIARWKSNNNIFNSTNEFCFSYLFKIPRRLKCSLEMRRRMPLPSYFLFHPSYFFSRSPLDTFGGKGKVKLKKQCSSTFEIAGAQSGNQNEREKVSRSGKKLISPPLMQFISFVRGSMGGGGAQ